MKKTYILFVILLFGIAQLTFAQKPDFSDFFGHHGSSAPRYPIPSYSAPVVNFANFTEQLQNSPLDGDNSEKRDVEISSEVPTDYPISEQAVVFVYRLDFSKVRGPFLLSPGGNITVGIDSKEWGVIVSSPYPAYFSVWIDGTTGGIPAPLP